MRRTASRLNAFFVSMSRTNCRLLSLSAPARRNSCSIRSSTRLAVHAGGGDSASERIARSVRYGCPPVQWRIQRIRSRPQRLRHGEMVRQDRRLVEGEVGQLDAVADVERRAGRVLDQIAGRGDADQHERQPLQLGLRGALLVEEADCGEEIVGEIEPQRRVDLVDEDDEPLGALLQHDLAEVARELVREGVIDLLRPPLSRWRASGRRDPARRAGTPCTTARPSSGRRTR